MDARIRLVKPPAPALPYVLVPESFMQEHGDDQTPLRHELEQRGIDPRTDIGEPVWISHKRAWRIPVVKTTDDC